MRPFLQRIFLTLGLSLVASFAHAQGGAAPTGLPQGTTREQMWPAPTAEDWKKPCLITWQRTYEDAVAVSRETKRPILICVNMDGEIASEHYAGVRYRQPEIAKLYEPYVCVIASVYRHNPRDYDEQGRRILCPRFGSVTCGEHIAIEPGLHDKFFDGKRVAPRHIGVELDSQEMYDVYYAWDTDTIFKALEKGIADRPRTEVVIRGDRPIEDRVAGQDIEDRRAVETAYEKGDRETRRKLLERAVAMKSAAPVEVLRLAVFGFDVELGKMARRALAESTSESAIDLIGEALRVPMDATEREALIAALERLGETYPRARTLAVVQRGLSGQKSSVDVDGWSKAIASAAPAAVESYEVESRLESRSRSFTANPQDPAARLDFAESCVTLATDPKTARKYARLLYQDARSNALEAEKLGAKGWRVDATLAIAASNLGDVEEARRRAESAVSALPSDAVSWTSSVVLGLFAEARQQAITKCVREKTPWPPQWLTDVHAAYSVLARHPFGTDAQVVSHYDFLKYLGAAGQAATVLDEGLARFPDAWWLHDRYRSRILAEKGADGLEPAYEALLRERADAPNLESFAGYASLVAAEFHRRSGTDDKALAAYDRGIAHYERHIAKNPDARATADHFIALALAGRARVAYEHKEDERALNDLLASFARKPEAAASLDGLNISPVDTAKMLRARFAAQKQVEFAARLQAALDKLDPKLLELPAYEREGPSGTSRDGRPPRRGGAPPEKK
jgi:tetratricopeptide (TPR) repeat protein